MRSSPFQTERSAPRFSANALTVLRRRYLCQDAAGQAVETPAAAGNIADAERLYDGDQKRCAAVAQSFYRIMRHLEFLPNSPTLMKPGRDLQQLSASFVLPVDDSLESIFEAVKHQALIHQSGGGAGFTFTDLRPNSHCGGGMAHRRTGRCLSSTPSARAIPRRMSAPWKPRIRARNSPCCRMSPVTSDRSMWLGLSPDRPTLESIPIIWRTRYSPPCDFWMTSST